MNRREFLKHVLAASAAPVILRAEWLMPVRPLRTEGGVLYVDTIERLRALPPLEKRVVYVRGYFAPDDGGGGTFKFEPTVQPENGGTIIGPRQRITLPDEPVSVHWFGALPGRGDASEAIRRALDASGTVFVPAGVYG